MGTVPRVDHNKRMDAEPTRFRNRGESRYLPHKEVDMYVRLNSIRES